MADKRFTGLLEHNENLNKQIKEYLQDALVQLLDRTSLNDITITELCARAGVSRMAFYGNYKTKYDLYEEIVRKLNIEMINIVGNPFNKDTDVDWYENFFFVMKENATTVKTVFRADRARYISALNSVVLYTRPLPDKQKYLRLMWTGGMLNATLFWIDAGMVQSVEEMAKYCYKTLNSALIDG